MSGGSMLGAVSFKVKRRNRMTSGGGNIAGMTRMMRLLAGEAWTDVAHIFFQAGDGIRYIGVTGVQTCALPIWVGAFAGQEQGAQGRHIVFLHEIGVRLLALDGAERRRRGEQGRNLVLGDDAPERAGIGRADRDRQSVVSGKSVDLGGRRIMTKT